MSDIEYTFWQNFDTSKVQVFGISVGESDDIARQFANNFGLTFPVLRDDNNQVYGNYRISGRTPYPRDYIVDQNGILQYAHSEYDPQEMLETIEELLVTDIRDEAHSPKPPGTFRMMLYPNPTNAGIRLEFDVPGSAKNRLTIYDVSGKRIKTLELGTDTPGSRSAVRLPLTGLASGIYLATLSNGIIRETKKMVLLR